MRSKSRIKPNVAILHSELSKLTVDEPTSKVDPASMKGSGIKPETIELQVKVKRPRGAPPRALINTKKLLCG